MPEVARSEAEQSGTKTGLGSEGWKDVKSVSFQSGTKRNKEGLGSKTAKNASSVLFRRKDSQRRRKCLVPKRNKAEQGRDKERKERRERKNVVE